MRLVVKRERPSQKRVQKRAQDRGLRRFSFMCKPTHRNGAAEAACGLRGGQGAVNLPRSMREGHLPERVKDRSAGWESGWSF